MKRIAVMTSGGDAPGMNAATRAAVRAGVLAGYRMFGVRDGYAGLMRGDLCEMGPRDVGGIIQQGGTILGTSGGVDVAIEALGTQQTFENALRALRPGGTLSSLGVYSGKLAVPYDAFAAGLGDHRIVTTLCPGGKERMRRLIETVHSGRVDLRPLITHTFKLEDIGAAYDLFASRREGVLKVAIRP